jgi:NADH dehydrogenase
MTFLVVGGGPTGVEMAGAIAEIARQTLLQDFRHIDSSQARVILIDNSPRILSTYVPELSESAAHQLADIGVDVRTGSRVQDIREHEVTLTSGETIAARTIVWAAGNVASPLGASLRVPLDRAGRVIVQPDLSVPGHPGVFVIGDMAHCRGKNGEPLPGLAPLAMQQGRHVAGNIIELLSGGTTQPFVYNDKGTMATIGRYRAVADLGFTRFTGLLAWLAWLFIHLLFLVSFRSKIGVLFSWGYTYLVFGRKARLITGRRVDTKPAHPSPEPPPPATQASVSEVQDAAPQAALGGSPATPTA